MPESATDRTGLSQGCRLMATASLDLDKYVYQRDGRGGHSRNAGCLADGPRADSAQLLLHFTGQAAAGMVVEPFGHGGLLRFLQTLDGALLLQKVAFVLDFRFHGLQFVAERGR